MRKCDSAKKHLFPHCGAKIDQRPVHTYPDIFESVTFSYRIRLPSTRIRRIRQRIRIFLNPLTRIEKQKKSATNPAACGRLNPDIFEFDDVAKSCPVSHRTINQYGGTMCRPRANKANFPLCGALYFACYRREARGTAVSPDTIGCVWTGKFNLNTLHVDGEFVKSGKKKLRIPKYQDTCGRGLSVIDKN